MQYKWYSYCVEASTILSKTGGVTVFKKNEFKAEVVRKGLTLAEVARELGLYPASLSRKINGNSDFYRGEIERIINLLNLSGEDVLRIFFAD